jgi:hypothetical protein
MLENSSSFRAPTVGAMRRAVGDFQLKIVMNVDFGVEQSKTFNLIQCFAIEVEPHFSDWIMAKK